MSITRKQANRLKQAKEALDVFTSRVHCIVRGSHNDHRRAPAEANVPDLTLSQIYALRLSNRSLPRSFKTNAVFPFSRMNGFYDGYVVSAPGGTLVRQAMRRLIPMKPVGEPPAIIRICSSVI